MWSNGGTTSSITNLVAGTYNVIVSDTNGCVDSTNIIVTEPSSVNMSLNSANITCNGVCDGTVNVITTGGSGNFKYTWISYANQNIGISSSASNLCEDTIVLIFEDLTFAFPSLGGIKINIKNHKIICSNAS